MMEPLAPPHSGHALIRLSKLPETSIQVVERPIPAGFLYKIGYTAT